MKEIGICALCRTPNVELIDSHVISKWIYRRILAYTPNGGPNGVAVSDGRAGLSGRQASKHLLCRPCEDLFGKWESYMSQVALQPDSSSFPALTAATTLAKDQGLEVAEFIDLDVSSITRFAVSVFWRADVADGEPLVDLGPARNDIRNFLLERGPLPDAVDVVLTLIRPPTGTPRIDRMLVYPGTDPDDSRRHEFLACGLRFTMFTAFPHLEVASLPRLKRVLISEGSSIVNAIAEEAQTSTAYGTLAARHKP